MKEILNELEEIVFESIDDKRYNAEISIRKKLIITIQDDDYHPISVHEFEHNYPGFGVGTSRENLIHYVASTFNSSHLLFNVKKIEITKIKDSNEVDAIKAYCL